MEPEDQMNMLTPDDQSELLVDVENGGTNSVSVNFFENENNEKEFQTLRHRKQVNKIVNESEKENPHDSPIKKKTYGWILKTFFAPFVFISYIRMRGRSVVESRVGPYVRNEMGGSNYKDGWDIDMKNIISFIEILVWAIIASIIFLCVSHYATSQTEHPLPSHKIYAYKSWNDYITRTQQCVSANIDMREVWFEKKTFCSESVCTEFCEIKNWLEKCVNYTKKNFALSTFSGRSYPCAMYLKLENGSSVFLLDPKIVARDETKKIKAPHSCEFVGLPLETSVFPIEVTIETLDHEGGIKERKRFAKKDVVLVIKAIEIMNREKRS